MKKTKQNTNKNKNSQIKKTVAVPSATAKVSRNTQPTIIRRSRDEITVTHREYIRELIPITDLDFATTVYTIQCNPGLLLTFPWLSTIATSYESYRFDRLKFIFETSVATSVQGAFIMAFDYDASDSKPTSRADFLNYEGAVKGPIWSANLEMPLDVKRLNKIGPSRYVRGGARPNTDIKTYDCGNLYYTLINKDVSFTSPYGDLFVEYTVTLQTPQLNSLEAISDNCSQLICSPTSNATFFNGVTQTGGLPLTCSGSQINFPFIGRYLITLIFVPSTSTTPVINWTSGGGALLINPTNWVGSVGTATVATRTTFIDVLATTGFMNMNVSAYAASNNVTVNITRYSA